MLTLSVPHSIISFATKKKLSLLGNCVTVARQTLTLFVGVRIPIPLPKKQTMISWSVFLYLCMVAKKELTENPSEAIFGRDSGYLS